MYCGCRTRSTRRNVYPLPGKHIVKPGLGIILDGIGNWVKVAVVNKVEKRFVKLHDRLREVTDIDWEEVK